MNIPIEWPLHLLHRNASGTLATHSHAPEGFPYPTIVPYATDARHRPVILVSVLAEHTRNLAADSRSGFLIADAHANLPSAAPAPAPDAEPPTNAPPGDGVLERARMTMLGRFVEADADPYLTQRYVRCHPDAERYLELGGFSFRVLECERLRYIGGFGRMGWLEAAELEPLEPLSFDEEHALWTAFDGAADRRTGLALLGVDRYGADWRVDGERRRTPFAAPQTDFDALHALLAAAASSL